MVTIGKSILGEMRLYSSLTGRFSDRLLIKEGNPVVNLATADLRNADLSLDDLSDVDLRAAQGVSESDLELQLVKLENTMMPDGSKHD
jgi:uncharacterized protein YjbI with pentapeptide repeats